MNKNKKILIATPLYPPQVGGPASRTALLEKEFPKRGIPVSVAKFSSVSKFPKVISHFLYFCIVLVKGVRANVILAQDPVSTGLPALLATKILGKRFTLIIVGDYAWEQGSQRAGVKDLLDEFSTEYDKYPFLVRLFKKIQFFVADHADRIIVPSFYLKKIVTNWGISEDKVVVIYNSFDPPSLDVSKEGLRNKLGLSGRIITSAGRLVPWKGFSTLISESMPVILKEFPDTKLYIIGDGPDKSHLEDVVKQSGMTKNVFITGRKPQSELFEFVRASDVFVLNTAYEGMSHQLLEVMALETPIVTTNIGGNLEVVKDGENGVLTDYNDTHKIATSIIKILKEPDWAHRFVLNGREKIKDYSEEKMLGGLVDVLTK